MKKTINAVAQTVTFTFEGGLEPVTISMAKVSQANKDYAMLHGMATRIGDNAAIAKSAENNFTVTEAMRRAEVETLVGFYENADNTDWNVKVASVKKVAFNPAIAAIAQKRGTTYEEAQVWFNAKLMAELAAM